MKKACQSFLLRQLSADRAPVLRDKGLSSKLYPPYYKVKVSKEMCYPSGISITRRASSRDFKFVRTHVFFNIIKWGCDGAEQNRYRQKISEGHIGESLFYISMMPIQMYTETDKCKKIFGKILHHLQKTLPPY